MNIQPRGTAKSANLTIPAPIWLHLHDSELACAVIAAKWEDLAEDFAKATRAQFEGTDQHSRLVELFGNFAPSGRGLDWRTDKMTTLKRRNTGRSDQTYTAYSVGKGGTGSHLDALIIDDPDTREKRRQDSNWAKKVRECYDLCDYILNRDGILIINATRYGEDDLPQYIADHEIIPAAKEHFGAEYVEEALKENDEAWTEWGHLAGWDIRYDRVYENYDEETERGDVVYPICWSHEKIAKSRLTPNGEAEFWFHLMNAPHRRRDMPVKPEHILTFSNIGDLPPEAKHAIDLHCDFAFKDWEGFVNQTGDWGVAHVVPKAAGHVYRVNGFRGKLQQDDFGLELVKLVKWVEDFLKARVRYITYDASTTQGAGDQSTDKWLYSLFDRPDIRSVPAPLPIRRQRGPGVKKIARVLETVWAWQQGLVHLWDGAPDNQPLIKQMLALQFTSHDDDRDAFADAFNEKVYQGAPLIFDDRDDSDEEWVADVDIPEDEFEDDSLFL
jgi:hypothetical protein